MDATSVNVNELLAVCAVHDIIPPHGYHDHSEVLEPPS